LRRALARLGVSSSRGGLAERSISVTLDLEGPLQPEVLRKAIEAVAQ
jgi:hypothetical protein